MRLQSLQHHPWAAPETPKSEKKSTQRPLSDQRSYAGLCFSSQEIFFNPHIQIRHRVIRRSEIRIVFFFFEFGLILPHLGDKTRAGWGHITTPPPKVQLVLRNSLVKLDDPRTHESEKCHNFAKNAFFYTKILWEPAIAQVRPLAKGICIKKNLAAERAVQSSMHSSAIHLYNIYIQMDRGRPHRALCSSLRR